MKNIICIDFSIIKNDDFAKICEKYSFKYEQLLSQHKKFDFYKIFIDVDTFRMFAYILNKNKSKIEVTDGLDVFLNSIKSEVVEKEVEVVVSNVEMTVDSILDKISKFGIGSLLKEEKEFLDNSSK
jgi:hypothetical protein